MTRKEFVNLKIFDEVTIAKRGRDYGKRCIVTDIFPSDPTMREHSKHGYVYGSILDGEFESGDVTEQGYKKLSYRCWKRIDNFVLNIINRRKGD